MGLVTDDRSREEGRHYTDERAVRLHDCGAFGETKPLKHLTLFRSGSCGSGLARDTGTAVYKELRVIVHRGQARSHRISGEHNICDRPGTCGSWLASDSGGAITGKLKPYTNSFSTFPIASSANPCTKSLNPGSASAPPLAGSAMIVQVARDLPAPAIPRSSPPTNSLHPRCCRSWSRSWRAPAHRGS